MKPISRPVLVAVAIFIALATWIVELRFYSGFHRSWWNLLFPWILTVVCVAAARWVKAAVDGDRIGQDRSQVQPSVIAIWLIVGVAAAWLGVVQTGFDLGGLMWAIPNWSEMSVAQEEGPMMGVGIVSGILLTISGLWLEKSCQLPPDDRNPGRPPLDGVPPTVGWEA